MLGPPGKSSVRPTAHKAHKQDEDFSFLMLEPEVKHCHFLWLQEFASRRFGPNQIIVNRDGWSWVLSMHFGFFVYLEKEQSCSTKLKSLIGFKGRRYV